MQLQMRSTHTYSQDKFVLTLMHAYVCVCDRCIYAVLLQQPYTIPEITVILLFIVIEGVQSGTVGSGG